MDQITIVGGGIAGRWQRPALLLVALGQAEVGIWGELSPHSFFTTFPGFGHHWVAMLGPYNEHLVRDYAAAELGFALLLVLSAAWFDRRVVLAAGSAFLLGTLSHLHLPPDNHARDVDD